VSKTTQTNATKLITPVAILSYPWLDEAQPPQEEGGKAMFSGALIFVPEIMAKFPQFGNLGEQFSVLKSIATAAASEKFGDKLPALLRNPNFKPGYRTDGDEKGYPAGAVYINARSERRPGLVYLYPDASGKPAIVPEDRIKEDFYPGALVRAVVRAYGFDRKGNRGVAWGLNHLQLIDGTAPRLDNRKAATEEFSADASLSPASLDDISSQ
jgi:ssDNA-binding protein